MSTYVNAEKLTPKVKGVEIWKIAVAIVGGLLLLLLIIFVLWVVSILYLRVDTLIIPQQA